MNLYQLEQKLFELEEEVKDLEMIFKVHIDLLKHNKNQALFQLSYMIGLYSSIAILASYL